MATQLKILQQSRFCCFRPHRPSRRLPARIFGPLLRRALTSSAVFSPRPTGGAKPSKLPATLAVRRRAGRFVKAIKNHGLTPDGFLIRLEAPFGRLLYSASSRELTCLPAGRRSLDSRSCKKINTRKFSTALPPHPECYRREPVDELHSRSRN